MTNRPIYPPLEALERYRNELCLHAADGRLLILPGAIATVFFERGSQPEVRKSILACFDRFEELFGEHLRSGRAGEHDRFTKRTPQGVAAIRDVIVETPQMQAVEAMRSSASGENTAPEYLMETLTNVNIEGNESGLSHLKFSVPMDSVGTREGIAQYEELLRFVCEQLPVHGGYGGLSPILPYSFHRYLPQEWVLAKRFSGLEIDSYGFMQQEQYDAVSFNSDTPYTATEFYGYLKPGATIGRFGHIKGVNWYTLIGDLFVDRLGGEAAVRAALQRPGIGIERIGECLLIRAGDFPRLGAPEEGLPAPYVFVNSVLRVLRDPAPDALQSFVPDLETANTANTRAWEARFDLPGAPPIPQPPKVVPAEPDPRYKL
jgi:hypothetical protein